MNEENIVSLSLNYYDQQKRKHAEWYKNDCHIELKDDGNDINLSSYTIFKNNTPVNTGIYNILGVYFKEEKQWTWGWMVNHKRKIDTYLSRQILNYGLDISFDKSVKSNRDMLNMLVRNDLLNPYISIEHPVQLEHLLALGQYLTNSDMIYRIEEHPSFGKNVVVYVILKYSDS